MTEAEFKSMLFALTARKSETRPSHLVNIEFYNQTTTEEVESFLDDLNQYLLQQDEGMCDIFGINENFTGGVFYLNLNEQANFDQLKVTLSKLVEHYPFLEVVTINHSTYHNGYYITESIDWGERDEDQHFHDLLPSAEFERVLTKEKGGCLGPIGVFMAILFFLILA